MDKNNTQIGERDLVGKIKCDMRVPERTRGSEKAFWKKYSSCQRTQGKRSQPGDKGKKRTF